MKHKIKTLLLAAGVLASPMRGAWAHAIIVQAEPISGAVVTGPDISVALRFNVRIDTERSTLSLTRADGSTTMIKIDQSAADGTLAGHLSGLTPGSYALHWQVLANDGHITRGDVPFTVAAQ